MCPNTSEIVNHLALQLDEIYTLKVKNKHFFSMAHCEKNIFLKKERKEKEKESRPFCTARNGLLKYKREKQTSKALVWNQTEMGSINTRQNRKKTQL